MAAPGTGRGDPPSAGLGPGLEETLRAGGYEVLGELGRGGMGVRLPRPQHPPESPVCAQDVLGRGGGPTAAARLRAEAEAVAQLRHPNVVQIYSVGEMAGVPFLELEYLPGRSLDDSPDGTTLLTASLDATPRFWDVESGRQLGLPLHHTDAVLSVAFHPDGRVVATGTRDGSAWLWRVPAASMEGDLARIDRIVEERTGLRSDER